MTLQYVSMMPRQRGTYNLYSTENMDSNIDVRQYFANALQNSDGCPEVANVKHWKFKVNETVMTRTFS